MQDMYCIHCSSTALSAVQSHRPHPLINTVRPDFNAIACVACVTQTKTARNANACVGKQPIMVATASTEYWLALAFVA